MCRKYVSEENKQTNANESKSKADEINQIAPSIWFSTSQIKSPEKPWIYSAENNESFQS